MTKTLKEKGVESRLRSEYYLHWYEAFWEVQNKVTRLYAQSGEYDTIVESRVHLTSSVVIRQYRIIRKSRD